MERSGRPPKLYHNKFIAVKRKVVKNECGWTVKEVREMIRKEADVAYTERHIYRLMQKWGVRAIVPDKRLLHKASLEERLEFKKGPQRLLRNIPEGFTVASEDESIFVQNIETKRVWAVKGIRPIRIVSGSHGNTVVFGAISLDGTQIFRQYEKFNGETFLDYLKKVHRKFG